MRNEWLAYFALPVTEYYVKRYECNGKEIELDKGYGLVGGTLTQESLSELQPKTEVVWVNK